MLLRKVTIDNSVTDIPKSEQTRETKQNTIKNKSTPRKQKKQFKKQLKISEKYISIRIRDI